VLIGESGEERARGGRRARLILFGGTKFDNCSEALGDAEHLIGWLHIVRKTNVPFGL
jgi:hypothetical protein